MTQIRVELPEALTRMPVKAFLTQKKGISSTQWKRIKHSGTFREHESASVGVER